MEPAIHLRKLSKDYGNGKGAFDIDLRVMPGEVFGFVGPNGAGKSTTIRAMLDLLRPTAGGARILGRPPQDAAARADIGYMPGELELPGNTSGRTLLMDLARLRGGVPRRSIDGLAKLLGANLDEKIRRLSKGNKQKIGIIQAFMHRPKLLILDEPTDGLDPLLRRHVQGLIQQMANAGSTVFLSSHVLSEVEEVCDRIAVIREGRIIAQGDLKDLRRQQIRRVRLRIDGDVPAATLRVSGVRNVRRHGDVLHVDVVGPLGPLLHAMRDHRIRDLDVERDDLEATIMQLYEVPG